MFKNGFYDKWYLAGGTALALQAGHRKSCDLAFFTENKNFKGQEVEKMLYNQGEWTTNNISEGTPFGLLSKTKMSLIAYPFFTPAEKVHILKSLVYFADAEDDPETEIYFKATWKEVKKFFTKEIPVIARKLIA